VNPSQFSIYRFWGRSQSESLAAATKPDFTLHIGPASAEIAKGEVIRTTGYNGSIPGPLLRMKEGESVSVDIFDDTDTPELVHWHWNVSFYQGRES
jgi:FtsP/CotA-like multicopper oxidase with cupredoxin domain